MDMMNQHLTIAIPCYDRVDFFEEALRSALNQSMACRVIAVDNGSKHDGLRLICERYGPRITYYRNDTNLGMFRNWNRCVELAETAFVMILGDDDVLDLNYSEQVHSVLVQHPDLDVIFSGVEFTGDLTGVYSRGDGRTVPYGPSGWMDLVIAAGRNGLGFPTVAATYRKSLFQNGGFRTSRHSANDWEFVYTKLTEAKFYGIDQSLLCYRKHEQADTVQRAVWAASNVSFIYGEMRALLGSQDELTLRFVLWLRSKQAFIRWILSNPAVARSILQGKEPDYHDLAEHYRVNHAPLIALFGTAHGGANPLSGVRRAVLRCLSKGAGLVESSEIHELR
jgi:glycosyltransferase involved in cell wall biosynthesis